MAGKTERTWDWVSVAIILLASVVGGLFHIAAEQVQTSLVVDFVVTTSFFAVVLVGGYLCINAIGRWLRNR